jgi:hypothetical protein
LEIVSFNCFFLTEGIRYLSWQESFQLYFRIANPKFLNALARDEPKTGKEKAKHT